MSNAKTTRFMIELTADLSNAVAKAAKANKITAEEAICECVSQSFETALRHRVLIQRQNDVDEALLELARLVGRLSAGPSEPQEIICRYRFADAE
jgi:4-hydroxy-3-methylbut-2-enyl diphosphate reductase IspH